MTEVHGRRELRRQRTIARRRNRRKISAGVALATLAMVGTVGAAASEDDLRATAGIQLASVALPLLHDGSDEAARAAEPAPSDASPSAEASPPAAPEAAGPTSAATSSGDEAAEADQAAVEQEAAHVAAELAAAEAAAAEQAAAEQAAAEQAAAEEAARIAAAAVPVDDPAGAKAFAASVLGNHGWDASQMTCLDTLWTKESEWLTSATNAGSGAYGIPQALPGIKLAAAGSDWQTNYRTQINWGLTYIESRYGSPCSALNFHYANNWY
ncbi:hypothetical protein LOC59_09760 [Arthrobacter sp. zg-Y916]|uniref:aggregation-promoting factor C-terminal-like domain-containing protein n=1 Tax=Arthrobacter sp. zg-Y916 TaxID=2894190 RepID=UPI001E605087|nr:hypothetical protein [Arthrobacter sp. zg-Y916]MCC9193924.1 hypothetical protein [Arthrobacter sp. zg-Y916]